MRRWLKKIRGGGVPRGALGGVEITKPVEIPTDADVDLSEKVLIGLVVESAAVEPDDEDDDDIDYYAGEDEDDEDDLFGPAEPAVAVVPVQEPPAEDSALWLTGAPAALKQLGIVGTIVTLRRAQRRASEDQEWEDMPATALGITRTVVNKRPGSTELCDFSHLNLARRAWTVSDGMAVFTTGLIRETYSLSAPVPVAMTAAEERVAAMTGASEAEREKVEQAAAQARAGLLAAIPTPEDIEDYTAAQVLHEFHSANRRRITATRDLLIAETHGVVTDEEWRDARDARNPAALHAEVAANAAFGRRIAREHDLLVSHLESGRLASNHENDVLDEEYGKARKAVLGEKRILGERLARIELAAVLV